MATLVYEKKPRSMIRITTKKIVSVSAYVEYVMKWKRENEYPVAFRGQQYADWHMTPKLFRPKVGLQRHEHEAVRDLVSIHPQEFQADHTMFDRLVRMQHFDLPTRLLDVTTNPLVALWFAAHDYEEAGDYKDGKVQAFFVPPERQAYYDSDRVSIVANLANLRPEHKEELLGSLDNSMIEFNKLKSVKELISYVRHEKPHFEGRINPSDFRLPIYVKPKMANRRILAQSGAFLIYARDGKGLIEDDDKKIRVTRVVIPHTAKERIRTELQRLGIYASALFPEIDKASQFIVNRYNGLEESARRREIESLV